MEAQSKKLGTTLGFTALGIAVITLALWFRQVHPVRTGRTSPGFARPESIGPGGLAREARAKLAATLTRYGLQAAGLAPTRSGPARPLADRQI